MKIKNETKWVLLALAALGLGGLALAPFPQGIKILGDLVFRERAAVATPPVAGTGTLYVKNTTPSTAVFVNDAGTEITLGAGGAGGAVDSVNGQTGAVALDADDIDDTSTTNKFVDAAAISKLGGIETAATADQSDAEIETAYNAQVAVVSQVDAEAGVGTTPKRWTAERVGQAITALAGSGGDPTYGSEVAASNNAVFVDENNRLGLGITDPTEELHVYRTDSAPRLMLQYYNVTVDDVTAYPATAVTVANADEGWFNPGNAVSDNATYAVAGLFSFPSDTEYLKTTNFSFAVPGGATIVGMEVEVEAQSNSSSQATQVYLVRGGTTDTSTNLAGATPLTGAYAIYTYGSPTEDWGGITPAEANDTGFGVAIRYSMGSVGVSIDFVRITLYYTTGTYGDYIWSSGADISDGAFTIRANATDQFRMDYTTGDAVFTGDVTAPFFYGDASNMTGSPSPADDSITNAKLAEMTAGRIKGRITTDGNPVDLTAAEVRTLLNVADGATASAGTVTSVAVTTTDGLEVDSGSPVTSTGTLALGINAATLYAHLMTAASTVTPVVTDSLLIADASDSGNVKDVLLSNFVLALSGGDDNIMKQVGSTGQLEQSGVFIDDPKNMTGLISINSIDLPTGSGYEFVMDIQAQTLTNKEIVPREAGYIIGGVGNAALDADLYDRRVITGTTGTATMANTTGTPRDWQKLEVIFNQEAVTAVDLTWGTQYKAATEWGTTANAIPAESTALDAWDYFLFQWNPDRSQWHLLAMSKGN